MVAASADTCADETQEASARMKRSDDQRLAERLGIKLQRRTGPHDPNGAWRVTWFGYSFRFTTLVVARGSTTRCRPGAQWYGTGFGATNDASAWTMALEQYALALMPSKRPIPLT